MRSKTKNLSAHSKLRAETGSPVAGSPDGTGKSGAETTDRARKSPKRSPSKTDSFFVAGIGASAGGLEALEQLLRALPPEPGIALILVQHFDPRHHSLLAEILSRSSRMPVHEAVDNGKVGKKIRDVCVFARHNLVNDPPFSRMDLVCCRNLLIYLGPALQKKVVPLLHYALQQNGVLFLGTSEGLSGFSHLFEPLDKKHRIFAHKVVANRNLDFARMSFNGQLTPTGAKANTEASESEPAVEREADRIVLRNYAPSGVLVAGNMNVLQFRGRTNRYLEPAPGKASLNLMRMTKPGLSATLQNAITEAKKTDKPAKRTHLPLQFDGETGLLTIEVFPIRSAPSEERCFLVLFEEEAITAKVSTEKGSADDQGRNKRRSKLAEGREIAHLRQELTEAQEALRAATEAHEAADEELRSANEEVLSANEELQSTNEELETSKEEMQSANEELTTLNDELRNRNHDLGQLNSDLVNLLGSINIPVIMIGHDLRIRRLTPSSDKAFNIISSDIGRPITDIRSKIDIPDLEQMILDVIDSLTPAIREVRDMHGHWYSLEIRPYRTVENKIDGVVLSLIDIDLQKRAAGEEQRSREFSEAVINTLQQPFLILDSNLRVLRGNDAFYRTFQVSPQETERELLYRLGNGQWDIPELRKLLEQIPPKSQEVNDFEVEHDFQKIGHRVMLLSARPMKEFSDGHQSLILLAINDVTDKKRAEEERLARIEELDRSNRAMVGRELRMIDLKKEINALLQERGEPARYPLDFEDGGDGAEPKASKPVEPL